MDMEDFLAGVPGRVDDDPVAAPSDPLLPRDLPGPEEHLAEQPFGPFRGVVEGGEMRLGNEKEMDGRLRADVLEGEELREILNSHTPDAAT